jgi:hypothetical protein
MSTTPSQHENLRAWRHFLLACRPTTQLFVCDGVTCAVIFLGDGSNSSDARPWRQGETLTSMPCMPRRETMRRGSMVSHAAEQDQRALSLLARERGELGEQLGGVPDQSSSLSQWLVL